MKYLHSTLPLTAGILMLACQNVGAASAPARMSEGSASSACLAQMQNFISLTEGQGLSTRLTPAAFAQSSLMSIAQAPQLDSNGLLAQGRERSMPSVYHLTKSAAGCTITREAGKPNPGMLLTHCTCAALGRPVSHTIF